MRRFSGIRRGGSLLPSLLFALVLAQGHAGAQEMADSGPLSVRLFDYGETGPFHPGTLETVPYITYSFADVRQTNALYVQSPRSGSWSPLRPPPHYTIRRWTTEQGLPGNKVMALCQTGDGYLWVGTERGVARFDGVQFTAFHPTDPLLRNYDGPVRSLYESEDGRLWIGTDGGLLCLDRDGKFLAVPGQEAVRNRRIYSLTPRARGGFWIATDQGLARWDGATLEWTTFTRARKAFGAAETGSGSLWVGTGQGLYEYYPDTGAIALLFDDKHFNPTKGFPVRGLFRDRKQRWWIGTGYTTYRMETNDSQPHLVEGMYYGERKDPINAHFSEDFLGNVWASSSKGSGHIVRFADDGDSVVRFDVRAVSAPTHCILADREGGIWAGAQDGLIQIRRRPFATVGFRVFGGDPLAVAPSQDGDVWLGGTGGFIQWSGREVTVFSTQRIPNRRPIILVAPGGNVWASYPSGGLLPLSPLKVALEQRGPNPQFSEMGVLLAACPGREHAMWLTTTNGIYCMRGEDKPRLVFELHGEQTDAMLEAADGSLWIGTAAGELLRFNKNLLERFGRDQHVQFGPITALCQSEDGRLWIGTRNGLKRFSDGQFAEFGPESGLPPGAIHGILEDQFGRLWINQDETISRVAVAELEDWHRDRSRVPAIARFGAEDGIETLKGVPGPQSCAKSSDGRLWFTKQSGWVVVDPAECPPSVPAPDVFLEQLKADGVPVPLGLAGHLSPGQGRLLEISFTATSLADPAKVRIQYRLDGRDTVWREAGLPRKATYTQLPPGAYRFRVRARNHEGRWSEKETVLALAIAPYFWQTRPFLLLSALAAGLSGGTLWKWQRWRTQRLLEEKSRQSVESERARIARNVHDHLGAALAEAALNCESGDSFDRSFKNPLDELNELVWLLNPEKDNLTNLAAFLSEYAARFLSAAGIRLEMNLPSHVPPVPIPDIFRQEVAAMFKEALRNVVEHARATSVQVSVAITHRQFAMTVRDDGCGFDPAECRSAPAGIVGGNGLRNFEERARALRGSCEIQSAPGKGTVVRFIFPLPRVRTTGRNRRALWPFLRKANCDS